MDDNKIIRHFRQSFEAVEYMKKAKIHPSVRSVNKYTKSGHYSVLVVAKDTFSPSDYLELLGKSKNYAKETKTR